MVWGGFWIALSFSCWVFRAFDGLSASFLVFYLFLVFVKNLIVGYFPPPSVIRSASRYGG